MLIIITVIFILATTIAMLLGVSTMLKAELAKKYANKIMIIRCILQAVSIALLLACIKR